MLNKILALIKKEFLIETSYRLAFAMNFAATTSNLLIYFFIDKLFGYTIAEELKEFGVNYFSYVLLSLAFFSYIGVGIGSFSSRLRQEQVEGTLESLLLTPTKISVILLAMGMWNLIFATLDVLIYVILGIFLFKINFSGINLLSALVSLILTIISFSSLGIISASFVVVFKRGNPAGWLLSTLEGLLGGVYFPITVLPQFLQIAARFFPITYAVRAMELAVYRGYSVIELKNELGLLLLFCVLLAPASLLAFNFALKMAKRDGSLAQY